MFIRKYERIYERINIYKYERILIQRYFDTKLCKYEITPFRH